MIILLSQLLAIRVLPPTAVRLRFFPHVTRTLQFSRKLFPIVQFPLPIVAVLAINANSLPADAHEVVGKTPGIPYYRVGIRAKLAYLSSTPDDLLWMR